MCMTVIKYILQKEAESREHMQGICNLLYSLFCKRIENKMFVLYWSTQALKY